MSVSIGLVGKPNVGKSTFFSAATAAKAEVANYPFTTIEPNRGVTFVRTPCPHVELDVNCTPNNAACDDGIRMVPIELVDVAGLVPGAHEGKGLGNKFLDDLRQADALIHIVDLSGSTDAEGNPVEVGTHDPEDDILFLEREIDQWMAGILGDGWERVSKSIEASGGKTARGIAERLAGLGVKEAHVSAALNELDVDRDKPRFWDEGARFQVASHVRRQAKPILIAGNRVDQADPDTVERIRVVCKERGLLFSPCSANGELALRNGSKAGVVDYAPGDDSFDITAPDKLNKQQLDALEYIRTKVVERHGGTGVTEAIRQAAYDLLRLITCYPVEDENKYTDKQGRVLPDAFLVPRGTTAKSFAYRVHTDLGDHFIRAVDGRTKRVIGADHELADQDVVRIVADA